MKNRFFTTVTFLIISTAALIFASCEIGLGDAVDTSAPTVDIVYPPKHAVIRESFLLAGNCNDDISVEAVKVSLTNTSTKTNYGPFDATLDEKKLTWSIVLNNKIESEFDAFNAYKQWELPDGDYIISAVSYDKINNASQEAAIPLSVDNTAPVLLVTKPLAVGDETASVYGRTLNVTGDIAEAHETKKLTFNYNEYDENTKSFVYEEPKHLEIRGFGTMSSDSPLIIAKLDKSTEETAASTLTKNYETIYGDSVDINNPEAYGKKLYYCGFLLEDNAKIYQTLGDAGAGEGNQTTQYYILSDIFNEKLFNEDTYSLNARNLMKLLSGQSNYSKNEISKITNVLSQGVGNFASSKEISAESSSKFSIDPKNNPIWGINNFEEESGTFTSYELGSAIPLVLKAGGDGFAIDKSSIEIKLYHLGSEEIPSVIDDLPYITLVKQGEYEDGKLKDIVKEVDDNALQFYITKNGNEVPAEGDVGIRVNHYYEFKLTGKDIAENPLDSKNTRYGFKRYSSFAAPRVMFETADGYFAENEYYSGTQLENTGIKIKGKIITATKDIEIESKDKIKLSDITITDTSTNADASEGVQYDYVIENLTKISDGSLTEGKVYNFTATITKKSGASLIPVSKGAYKYKVGFIAEDSLNGKNEASEFEFKLDTQEPEILQSEISVTPTVTREGKTYVNGTVSVRGNVSDTGSGFAKLYYYKKGSDTPTYAMGTGSQWAFDFDTTLLTDNEEYTIYITAEDKVGNKLTIPYIINVNQETDRPVITFTNDSNIFTKTSNVLVGNITDDDGLKKVTATYERKQPFPELDEAGEPVGPQALELAALNSGSTSYSINAKLPDAEGEYEIVINAEDTAGLSTGKATKTITVKKDNGAPSFAITKPNATKDTYYNSDVIVNGTIKDGSGIAAISRQIYKVEETDIKVGTEVTLESAATIEEIVAGTTWADTIQKATENGIYKVVYTAKDKYEQPVIYELVFSMDIEKPTVDTVKFDDEDITNVDLTSKWYKKNSGEFSIITSDSGSSVASVSYSKDGTTWISMAANSEQENLWNSNITFDGEVLTKDLYIKAVDLAGNESEIKHFELQIDLKAPALNVEVLNLKNEVVEGNLYVNGKNSVNIRGTYSDAESGALPLKFTIDETDITESVTITPVNEAQGTFSAVIAKTALKSGTFKVIGKDNAENEIEVDATTIILDTEDPEIKELSLFMQKTEGENTVSKQAYKKVNAESDSNARYYIRNKKDGKLNISGTATDNIAFDKITLNISGIKIENSEPVEIELESIETAWSFDNIDLSEWKSVSSAKLTATDLVGNSVEVNFDIIFDETNPVLDLTTEPAGYYFRDINIPVEKYTNIKFGNGRYSEHTYGKLTAIDITTKLTEQGSGLSKLEYRLYGADSETKTEDELIDSFDSSNITWTASGNFNLSSNVTGNDVSATASISGFKATTDEKINYLLLRPIDNCGNAAEVTVLSVHVDQIAPTVVATSTDKLTNGTSSITVSGAAYDVDAGLKALRVLIDGEPVLATDGELSNEYGTFTYTGYAPQDKECTFENAASYATWTLTLTPTDEEDGWFKKLTAKNTRPEISIEAEDWAEDDNHVGNIAPNPTKVAVLKIDSVPPEVNITNPTNGLAINGLNTIRGNSKDEGSTPVELSLYYSLAETAPQTISGYTLMPIDAPTLKTTGENSVNVSKLYNFTFDVNFDDATNNKFLQENEASKDIWILAIAKDEAGNVSTIQNGKNLVKYTIDRNTDRPVVTITDVDLSDMTEDEPHLLKEQKLTINITDDDGAVKSAEYRTTKAGTNPSEDDWQTITLKNGRGSFELQHDGKQGIEFKVVDNNDNTFGPSENKDWLKVYVEDTPENAENEPNQFESAIHVILDLLTPVVSFADGAVKLGIAATEEDSEPADDDWKAEKDFNTMLGGKTKYLWFKFKATDEGSGIAKDENNKDRVVAEVKLGETEVTDSPYIAEAVDADNGIYIVKIPCGKDKISGNGLLNVKLVATDKAGREGEEEVQFDIDNTPPEITIITPDNNSEQSGIIEVIGTIKEDVKLYYAVSPLKISPDKNPTEFSFKAKTSDTGADSGATLPTTDKDGNLIDLGKTEEEFNNYLKELCAYKEYDNELITTFDILFDGDNSTSDHTSELNTWLTNLGITTSDDIGNTDLKKCFDDYVTLYLHIKAIDTAGNQTELAYPTEDSEDETEPFAILVNPQGTRPKVEFTSPKAEESILGGRINVMGTVSGNNNNSVNKVYMQIDCNGDDKWTKADEEILEDDNHKYTLTAIPGLKYEDGTTPQKGIEIEADESWSLWINEDGEFNDTDKPIKLRVYSYDSTAELLSSAKIRTITIDDDIPVMDPDIKLVQWNEEFTGDKKFTVADNTGKITFASDAVKAIRKFENEMFISGIWFVVGTVSDDSGIKEIKLGGENGDLLEDVEDAIKESYTVTKTDEDGTEKTVTNYAFCFPIGSDEPNAVNVSNILFYAKDAGDNDSTQPLNKTFTVNCDNKAPLVSQINDGLKIYNDNRKFTFGSIATENTVDNGDKTVNQSGIERIVFYFTRDKNSTPEVIYDPMLRKGAEGNERECSDASISYDEQDYLYGQTESVTIKTKANDTTTLTLGADADIKNIHTGGITKVDGVIYRIKKIENNDVTISGVLSDDVNDEVTAFFAIANVIDHTLSEKLPSSYNDRETDYGYGYPDDSNWDKYDDGDLMPETFTKGTTCTWDASINSKNLSDGPVTLHYIVFDKAGNPTNKTVNAMVQNNAPRIAGVSIGTDDNDDGEIDDNELITAYSGKFKYGSLNGYNTDGTKATTVTIPSEPAEEGKTIEESPKSVIKIKRKTVIKPEIVGGNGTLGYTYKVYERKGTAWDETEYTELADPVTLVERETSDENALVTPTIELTEEHLRELEIKTQDKQKFSFIIWDSTPNLTFGENTQNATLNLIMDVILDDSEPAQNKIIPFYWKNKDKNSLADNNPEKGHIELSKDWKQASGYQAASGTTNTEYDADPKVSGAFKLEGIARDNSLLKKLTVNIGTDSYKIAEYKNGNWTECANLMVTGEGETASAYMDVYKKAGKWYINDTEADSETEIPAERIKTDDYKWKSEIREATAAEYTNAEYPVPQGKTLTSTIPYTSQDYGHVVHWTMTIDTEKMGITPQVGKVIIAKADDKGKPNSENNYISNTFVVDENQTGGQDGSEAHTCKYTIDVVPYIQGIKTFLSTKTTKKDSSEYDRTALGHYPVASTEQIYIYGFNLEGGKLYDSANHSVDLGTSSNGLYPIVEKTTTDGVTTEPKATLENFTSGEVTLKVGDIESLNNKNNNDSQGSFGAAIPAVESYGETSTKDTFSNFYNRKPNSTNNYILTDDVILDVWKFNDRAAKPYGPGTISDPVMKINPSNGMIGFAYQSGTRAFSMADKDNSYIGYLGGFDNFTAVSFAYDSAGNTFGTVLGGDINKKASVSKFSLMSSIWGSSGMGYYMDKKGIKHLRIEQIGQIGTKANKNYENVTGGENALDVAGYNIDKNRILSPSLAISGSGENEKVYLAYYDHFNKEIRFRWAESPKTTEKGFNGTKKYLEDTFGTDLLGGNGTDTDGNGNTVGKDKYNILNFQIIAEDDSYTYPNATTTSDKSVGTLKEESTALGKAGQYVCIDVIPAGTISGITYDIVVLVWYDATNNNLMYTYNKVNLATPERKDFEGSVNTKAHWAGPFTILQNAGMYCQVKADKNGGIHIAGYDKDSGDLRYAKLNSYTAAGYNENTMSCIVDSNGFLGTGITLDVAFDNEDATGKAVPYIGYYGAYGPKMAYLSLNGKNAEVLTAGAKNDRFTGYWEVTELPTTSNAPKDRINIGLWKDTDGVISAPTTTDSSNVEPVQNKDYTFKTGTKYNTDPGTKKEVYELDTTEAKTYGNGTSNPVLAYQIRPSSASGFIETAQMQ